MSITQANGACPAILVGIDEVLKESDPQSLVTKVGATQSLFDPENRRPVTMQQMTDSGNGHIKPVRIMHKQRILPSDVSDTKSCDPGTEKAIFEELFTVNQYRQITIKKSEAAVRQLCDAYSQFVSLGATGSASQKAIMRDFANDLIMDLDPLRQQINADILTSVALAVGDFADGQTSPLAIPVLQSATNHSVNLAGFNIMRQQMLKLGYTGMPLMFGGGNMDFALMSLGYGCCNDGGTDFTKVLSQVGFKWYRDYADFNTYFGNANAAIGFMPGTLQFVAYNEYVGSFAQRIGTMDRGTIPDPAIPGLSYDIRILPNECDEDYDIFVGLHFDLYSAPTTLFQTGDRLEGVNGVVQFNATTVS